jgi:hypothetical protein
MFKFVDCILKLTSIQFDAKGVVIWTSTLKQFMLY